MTNQVTECDASLTYFFEVFGHPNNVIPLDVKGFGAYQAGGVVVSDKGSTEWDASAGISLGDSPVVRLFATADQLGGAQGGTLFANVTSDTVFEIIADAEAGANNILIPDAITDVVAYADPQVTFAPGFNSTGYTLVFSPGIVNGAPRDSIPGIPEPGSLTLAGVGAAGLLARAWRRRKPPAA